MCNWFCTSFWRYLPSPNRFRSKICDSPHTVLESFLWHSLLKWISSSLHILLLQSAKCMVLKLFATNHWFVWHGPCSKSVWHSPRYEKFEFCLSRNVINLFQIHVSRSLPSPKWFRIKTCVSPHISESSLWHPLLKYISPSLHFLLSQSAKCVVAPLLSTNQWLGSHGPCCKSVWHWYTWVPCWSSNWIGQFLEQYPYSLSISNGFPLESTLVEHQYFVLSCGSIWQPKI